MKQPDLSIGTEQRASITLPPEIGEQDLLADRIKKFLLSANDRSIVPSQRDREYKNISVRQPNGLAKMALMYSQDVSGRLVSEVRIGHREPETSIHYTLLGDKAFWHREQRFARGHTQVSTLSQNDMLEDMSEYVPESEFAHLSDGPVSAHDVIQALTRAVALKATQKTGTDFYRVFRPLQDPYGYASGRQIELIDRHVNNRVIQRLSVTAIMEVSPEGPIDVEKTLSYHIKRSASGATINDAMMLSLSSRDGISKERLKSLLNPTDTHYSPIQVLHRSLDEIIDAPKDNPDAA